MSHTWRTVLWVMVICGGACLVAGVGLFLLLAAMMGRGERIDRARPTDMAKVLEAAHIGRDVKVLRMVHSYQSSRSPVNGDHVHAFCMEIDPFPESVVGKATSEQGHWLAAPLNDPNQLEAIQKACEFPRSLRMDWFPSPEEVNTDRFCVSFLKGTEFGSEGRQVHMMAYDRQSRLLYYSDSSW
jgi:hypothetical protein